MDFSNTIETVSEPTEADYIAQAMALLNKHQEAAASSLPPPLPTTAPPPPAAEREQEPPALPPLPDVAPEVGSPEWESYRQLLVAHAAAVVEEDVPPQYGEDAMAWQFSELHKDDLRFVNTFGFWYHWEGNRWKEDGVVSPVVV